MRKLFLLFIISVILIVPGTAYLTHLARGSFANQNQTPATTDTAIQLANQNVGQPQRIDDPEKAQQIALLSQRVDELTLSYQALLAHSRKLESIVSVTENSSNTSPQQLIDMPGIPLAVEEEDAVSRISRLDADLLNKASDLKWETHAESDIEASFANRELSQLTLVGTYCRGDTCRLELSHSDPNALEEIFSTDFELVPWKHRGKAQTVSDYDGQLRTVLYLTRL